MRTTIAYQSDAMTDMRSTINDQSEYRPIWLDLADMLDTYPSGPTPAELGPR